MSPERTSDDELLARYRNGELRAFDLFYQRHHRLIFRFLIHRLGSKPDAEEAFQETFLRIHRSIASYDPRLRALPWIFTIARNVALDTVKRRKHMPLPVESAEVAVPTRVESALMAREELRRLLHHLSDEDRTLIELRLFDEEEFDRVAKTMGTAESTARQRLSRLLRKLRA